MILAMLLGAAQATAPRPMLDCTQISQAAMTSREEGVPEPKHATDVQLMASHSLCQGWEISTCGGAGTPHQVCGGHGAR